MLIANKIPHLTSYRQKMFLPKDEKNKAFGHMIILNNKNYTAVENLSNHKLFNNQNSYNSYFIDPMFRVRINNQTYNNMMRNERTGIYKILQRSTGLRMVDQLSSAQGKNIYNDLFLYNRLFMAKSANIQQPMKRAVEYARYIGDIVRDKRWGDYQKTMFVDLTDWLPSLTETTLTNPIMIFNFLLFRDIESFKMIGDIDIILYTDSMALRINPSECDKYSYRLYRRELGKMNRTLTILNNDGALEKMELQSKLTNKVVKGLIKSMNFTGGEFGDDDEIQQLIVDKAESELRKRANDTQSEDELADDVIDKLTNDKEFNKELYSKISEKATGKSKFSSQRDAELRELQKQIKIDNMTLEEMRNYIESDVTIPVNDISDKVQTLNKNVTQLKYTNFNKTYDEKLYKKDVANIFMDLNNKSIPMYIRNVEVVDSSDEFNYKDTWIIELEDANRVRHKVKVDLPKFIDGEYMYLNGNKKQILNQLMNKPVVKTGPDKVMVTGNYSKITVYRKGNKITKTMEKLKKFLLNTSRGGKDTIICKNGNVSLNNKGYRTTLCYDELSTSFAEVKINGYRFIFDQDEISSIVLKQNIIIPSDKLCVGFKSNEPILIDPESNIDIDDLILSKLGDDSKAVLERINVGKKFVISTASIMSKEIPLIFLLGYFEGLTKVIRKANLQHRFSDTKPEVGSDEGVIRFRDTYLIYAKKPMENNFLMNPFDSIDTMAYDYSDFDEKEVYLTIVENIYGKKGVASAFNTFYNCMIDPITRDVCLELNLPTDLVGLLLYANKLLTDNFTLKENNMNIYRIRSNEVVAGILHKELSNAYGRYANSQSARTKVSVQQDIVLKTLMGLPTVEDRSVLNPIYELDKNRTITPKGHSGLNSDKAYTLDKRAYDPSMMGILAMSTSPDYNVGKVRVMTMEPELVNARGYVNIKGEDEDSMEELTDANLFSPAEMLTPGTAANDDSIRVAMASKQSKHIVPSENASPVLISNGAEQVIQHQLSSDFAVTAKMDGEVLERDDKLGLMIIKYSDGEIKAINLANRIDKNGAGGFYLSNRLECKLQAGDKFDKNDIIATDSRFFSNDTNGNRFNLGVFTKVACYSSYCTFEDSSPCTHKLASRLGTEIAMEKSVTLARNFNISNVVKVGQEVKVGQPLLEFEQSTNDEQMDSLLINVGADMGEDIKTLGKNVVKSKYNCVIADIKIYADCELDEMSPSLQAFCKPYFAGNKKKAKLLDKYDKDGSIVKCGMIFNEPTGRVTSDKFGKVKGEEIDGGVIIKFYLKFKVNFGIGDKMVFYGALKSIISELIPQGQEPFTPLRPEEEISSMVSANSVLKRMVPSVIKTMLGNKVLVELKRSLQKIAEE